MRLFAPEGSAEGCASGECIPDGTPITPPSVVTAAPVSAPASGSPAPQHPTPQRAAPQSPAPQSLAPQSPAPRSPAPQSPAPQSPAPQSPAPQSPAAQRPAPAAPAPARAAPATAALPRAADPEEVDDEPPPAPAAGRGASTEAEQWRRAVDAVREASPRHGKSLSYARFLGFVPEGVKVAFPPTAAFHRSQVLTGMSRAMVETELGKSLRRPIKLVEDTSTEALQAAPKSIAEVEASDRASRERAIDEKVRKHPALHTVLKHLGGSLEHVSYLEPAERPPAVALGPDEGDGGPPVD